MNTEVENRVGDINAEREQIKIQTDEFTNLREELESTIEKMRVSASKRKIEFEKMQTELDEEKTNSNRLSYKIKTLEKKLVSAKS